jgi:hypothetical protein
VRAVTALIVGFDSGSDLAGFLTGPDDFAPLSHCDFMIEVMNDEGRSTLGGFDNDGGAGSAGEFLAVAADLVASETVGVAGCNDEIPQAFAVVFWSPENRTNDDMDRCPSVEEMIDGSSDHLGEGTGQVEFGDVAFGHGSLLRLMAVFSVTVRSPLSTAAEGFYAFCAMRMTGEVFTYLTIHSFNYYFK